MNPWIALVCFPVIFVGELPDKTMFASLVLATRGRPRHVWVGAAAAFLVHVVIATTVGVAVFKLLPHRVVDVLVAVMFLAGAAYAWREGGKEVDSLATREASRHGALLTSFVVIFLAEWGDLTQILTANLAARYHSVLSVGVGAVLALWAVAGLAVLGGRALPKRANVATIRRVTAAALVVLAGFSLWQAVR
ncbi:MAG TPA: TMEM165/GDT1 family protein [Acidimicrobiales bacterium]|nr:TMEM165/GDT1 family protein [Acidimicrobiales bacterium]